MRTANPAPIGQKRTGVPSLDWGNKHERQAAAEWWLRHPEYEMEDEGWCYWHDPRNKVMYELCGTSPDRTLYRRLERVSGVEVKCPYSEAIHDEYCQLGVVPAEYRAQVAWHMICTDTPYWWFVSFDPRRDDERRLLELKVERDWAYEGELMDKVTRFIAGYLAGEEFKPKAITAATYDEVFGK